MKCKQHLHSSYFKIKILQFHCAGVKHTNTVVLSYYIKQLKDCTITYKLQTMFVQTSHQSKSTSTLPGLTPSLLIVPLFIHWTSRPEFTSDGRPSTSQVRMRGEPTCRVTSPLGEDDTLRDSAGKWKDAEEDSSVKVKANPHLWRASNKHLDCDKENLYRKSYTLSIISVGKLCSTLHV